MTNAYVQTFCATKISGAELELTLDPKPPVAGQPITLTVSSDFRDDITAGTYIYIKLLEGAIGKEPLERCEYKQKICIGNEALCPISVGKTVKVITNITMLSEIEIKISDLIILAYIGKPRESDGYVETIGCACYSSNPTYCTNLSHNSF
ncbi:175_t:CDS:1 [Cetraspora pellucida]|uniref:175_t:CDS:1 n=1 Tax=Cetraspora pellucida TaxID=1433469 RepID=A0A9N8VMJ2_9GLOM|nr:175_t:CDS:1 [Cetraspora pellucida]